MGLPSHNGPMGLLHASKAHDTSCVQHIPLKKKKSCVQHILSEKKTKEKKVVFNKLEGDKRDSFFFR